MHYSTLMQLKQKCKIEVRDKKEPVKVKNSFYGPWFASVIIFAT